MNKSRNTNTTDSGPLHSYQNYRDLRTLEWKLAGLGTLISHFNENVSLTEEELFGVGCILVGLSHDLNLMLSTLEESIFVKPEITKPQK